jgi:hypothetical protein
VTHHQRPRVSDRVRTILQENARNRASNSRAQTPPLGGAAVR